jgi:hypothetical protein
MTWLLGILLLSSEAPLLLEASQSPCSSDRLSFHHQSYKIWARVNCDDANAILTLLQLLPLNVPPAY